ncbi:MAG TPA: TlpA disulfide reductase family protein [Thermoanaerobaculia bacterium]|jgi:peroxiredoxin
MKTRVRRDRRPPLAVLAGASLALLVTCGGSARESASDVAGAAAAATIPDFELVSLGGGTLHRDDFAGRIVLYEFWATWCAPCHIQVEILKELYPRARSAGVEFVAVASGEPEEIVRRWAAEHPLPYPSLLDPDERLSTALEVLGLPTLVVADAAGVIVWRQTSLTDAETLVDVLRRAGAAVAD